MCLYYWWGSFNSMKMAAPLASSQTGRFSFSTCQEHGNRCKRQFLFSLKMRTTWVKYQLQISVEFVLANWSNKLVGFSSVSCQPEMSALNSFFSKARKNDFFFDQLRYVLICLLGLTTTHNTIFSQVRTVSVILHYCSFLCLCFCPCFSDDKLR